jgi:dTDP-glucose 4,6-dehydratase
MKILVTGGLGFIGSNFVRYMLNAHPDYQLVNLDKMTYAGIPDNLRDIEGNKNYKFVQGDICDKDLVNDLVKEIDVIVNFAAESHNDRANMDPMAALQTNTIGTEVLLDAAVKSGKKRFHHISTDEVFGHLETKEGYFTEDTPYHPRSFYPASKAAADWWVYAYFTTKDLPITISNCSNNFGPYQHPEKIIPLFVTNLIEGKKVPVYGDGSNIRDWLYVQDHCSAIDLILHKGKIGETYNIGTNCEVANMDLTKKILKLLGKGEDMIEFAQDRPSHDWRYAIDASKIKKELDWKPICNFDEALEATVKWYQDNQQWWRKIKSGEYLEYYKKQYSTIT